LRFIKIGFFSSSIKENTPGWLNKLQKWLGIEPPDPKRIVVNYNNPFAQIPQAEWHDNLADVRSNLNPVFTIGSAVTGLGSLIPVVGPAFTGLGAGLALADFGLNLADQIYQQKNAFTIDQPQVNQFGDLSNNFHY
jgi:hypothetical protein